MASHLEKVTIPIAKEKHTEDYLRYSLDLLNVSMRDVVVRAVVSTTIFYSLLFLLRAGPLGKVGPIAFLITLFMERSLIQHVSTFSFFTGFWFLVLKLPKVDRESEAFNLLDFPAMKVFPMGTDEAVAIGQQLIDFDDGQKNLIVIRRLETAIQRLIHTRSTGEVHDVLSTMSEVDRGIADASYRVVRFSVWLIPVMGFLGTVMGISKAISEFATVVASAASLSLNQLKPVLGNATYNLGVAFDTTMLALGLSAILVLLMFYVQRKEEVFLSAVDEFCVSEIVNKLYMPDPDTQQILGGLERVTDNIDETIGDLAGSLNLNFTKLNETLEKRDEQAMQKLLETVQNRFTQFLDSREDSDAAFQTQLGDLMNRLAKLVDKGKAIEGFVAGLGNIGSLEKILKENQETLKALQKNTEQQQKQTQTALGQNKQAFDQLLPPLQELAKGIKIRVGE